MVARRVKEALLRRDQRGTRPLPLWDPPTPRKVSGVGAQRKGRCAGSIDPDFLRNDWRRRPAAHKAFRVGLVRAIEDALASTREFEVASRVDVGGREEADAFVAVLVVVPVQERTTPGLG